VPDDHPLDPALRERFAAPVDDPFLARQSVELIELGRLRALVRRQGDLLDRQAQDLAEMRAACARLQGSIDAILYNQHQMLRVQRFHVGWLFKWVKHWFESTHTRSLNLMGHYYAPDYHIQPDGRIEITTVPGVALDP
jgi:hypothetical protein